MTHLTEDQIEDFLIDDPDSRPDAAAEQHLAGCSHCKALLAAEREHFDGAMGSFNQATLAWAEAKSNTLSRDLPKTRSITGRMPLPAWSLAAAAAAALLIGVALETGKHAEAPVPTQSAAANPVEDRFSEIAQDNALLAHIDQALDAPVASPTALFDLPSKPRQGHTEKN